MYTRSGLGFVSFSKVTRVILQDKTNLKKRKVIGIINEFFSGAYKPLLIIMEGSAKKERSLPISKGDNQGQYLLLQMWP